MVINGGARSGAPGYAAWLGKHLTRTDSNERVFVRSLDGVAADDLADALLELSAMAECGRSKRGLYHANIDWKHTETLTPAQKQRAVDRLADELELTGQPRVVVEHVKEGREHLHVVWMRIDPETGKAISDSHNFRRHEAVARELEREFGLDRVQGVHIERDGIERPERTPAAFEFAQAERSGITPAEARADLSAMWRSADTGHAFAASLAEVGWTLAQGDKRDVLVALDPAGETHAINKKITGLAAKDVRARLADLDAATLPSVDQARQAMRERQPGPVPEKMGGIDLPDPAPEALHGLSYEVELEPPPDLEDRFGPTPEAAPYVPDFLMVVDLDQMPEDRWGRSHDVDPDAGLIVDVTPEPAAAYVPNFILKADLEAENTPQHRQARPRDVQEPEPEGPRRHQPDPDLHRPSTDNDARRAMEDLARTDPLGMAARHGFHAGDQLKSPEDMRREMADRMRSFATPMPDPEPTPEPMPWGRMLRALAEADARQTAPDIAPEAKTPERNRLADIVAAARARLAALADRLDLAFSRIRDQVLKPKPEASHPMSRAPESGPVNARMAADLQPKPKPAPSVDEDRAREIQRQMEAGRKAEPYDRDRMRDLSRQHYELRGAAPDTAPAPKPSPPVGTETAEDREKRIRRLTDELAKSWQSRKPPHDFSR